MSGKQLRESLFLAENIALLSLLSAAPTAPHLNPVDDQLTHEVHVTNTIAYISGISDDPSHVVAACVEGLASGSGIRVVVAINKERQASNKEVLARIKKGLDQIFGHLARVNREQNSDTEDMVVDAIVRMCKDRIFSRIKSRRPDAKYSKGKSKAFLGSLLQQVIDAQGNKEAADELKHQAKKARSAAKQAAELVEQQQQHASSAGSPSAAGEAEHEPASKPGRVLEPRPELEPEPEPDPVPVAAITTKRKFISTLATPRSRFAEVHIHWLPRRRAAAFYTARPRGFVELEAVRSDVDFDSGSSECVYVAYAGEVVMVDFVRGIM
ncbi:uncharacterized protein B0T15DRAFT_489337 [Chaetomium strumarium]|uniref:Uncharacterized protein n=1 Tax=Chaetomium strumarium TaxID=1170767 RepID=A0AAJ0H2K1_9PEZI|nr:hypothetical protein B0T15DRAFT_489337 [Chaetomium strumarium]